MMFPWDNDTDRGHVHRLFDTLDPHTAGNVEPHVAADGWAEQLSSEQQRAVVEEVRSLDPANLSERKMQSETEVP